MRRVACISLLLATLLPLVPTVAANPPAPTLSGTEAQSSTTLTWSAPSGAAPTGWTLERDSGYDVFDARIPFQAATTTYTDNLVPLPGDRFVYTITYTEQGGAVSDPSNPVQRDGRRPCETGYQEDCCYIAYDPTGCGMREFCSLPGTGLACDILCPIINSDLTRIVHDLACTREFDLCDYIFGPLPPSQKLERACQDLAP